MLVPLKVVSDYSILKSLIKIDELILYLKKHNISACALVDDNLFGSIEFFNKCIKNNIKPIIGLEVIINNYHLYLYAKNNMGYKTLIKINTLKQIKELDINDIDFTNLLVILPYNSKDLYSKIDNAYLGYETLKEREELKNITDKVVFVNEIKAYEEKDLIYLDYLNLIKNTVNIDALVNQNKFNYFPENLVSKIDELTTNNFIKDICLDLNSNERYIPVYPNELNDSYQYLSNMANKGLKKRYNNNVPDKALERLNYELEIIKNMKFVDYFLIVYDYVLYAKKHNILVGPGRGSAAGSLVSYSLGITNVNPLDYDLLFERFLNPERVTMPDIDIDFEFTKRNLVIDYVKEKYGPDKVAPIITYGTLASKQVIRDVGKMFKIDSSLIDKFVREIDAKESLLNNSKKDVVKKFVINYPELKKVYKTALKFEGLKRHISTHAAGIVICSKKLDDLIPVYYNNNELMTGYTMEYLEDLGLLKMDFLALKNLSIISNVLELVYINKGIKINLNNINLEDPLVYKLFQTKDTEGVFQFESTGMKNMLKKMRPNSFSDLVAAIALFRPGPMEYIDTYIRRKDGLEKVTYLDESLESILKDTYGIIIYQEQIMQILVKMANYTFAEADNVRRAMSKKKAEVLIKEKDNFITKSVLYGHDKEISLKVYEMILKFANYGFNKAHSVSYSLIGYQMAYLKTYFVTEFITNLLNMSIGSEEKTKEYMLLAKKKNLEFLPVDINYSENTYIVKERQILLPMNIIKNIGSVAINAILKERKNGKYKDFFDFVARTYPLGVNKLMLENLIKAGAFTSFGYSKKALMNNIMIAINYATLINDLDENLVMKPDILNTEEYDSEEERNMEYQTLGFYLTNHPASKYTNVVKIVETKEYFDKTIKMVVLIENIKRIKTKKNENMAFLTISDETGEITATLFSNSFNLLENCKEKDMVELVGRVMKRYDEYNINIINLTKL